MRKGLGLLFWGAVSQIGVGFAEVAMTGLVGGTGLPAALLAALGGVLLCLGLQETGRSMPGIERPLLLRSEIYALAAAVVLAGGTLLLGAVGEEPLRAGLAVFVLAVFWGCSLLRCEGMFLALEQAEALFERNPAPLSRSRIVARWGHFAALCGGLGSIVLPNPRLAALSGGIAAALAYYQAAVLAWLRKQY